MVVFFLAYDLCKAESLQGNPADGSKEGNYNNSENNQECEVFGK